MAGINWLPVASDFTIVVCGMSALRLLAVFAYSRQITTQTENVLEKGETTGSSSYVALLRQCCSTKAFSSGKRVHAHIIKDGYVRERFLGNLLVQMYGRCCSLSNARNVFDTIDGKNVFSWTIMIATYGHYGYLEDARELFDKMPQRNLVSWNAMIAAYTQHGEEQNALSLFRQMELQDTEPDKTTLFNVLSACTNLADITEGKHIHDRIIQIGYEQDMELSNVLLQMYCKCGALSDAQSLFDKMTQKTLFSWSLMISAYAQNEYGREAIQLLYQMEKQGIAPDTSTFISCLSACSNHVPLDDGKRIHKYVIARGYDSDIVVGTTLINMYNKMGSLEDAQSVFDKMHLHDHFSWTAIISAYAQHGKAKEALSLLQKMEQGCILPDSITFISVLSACASGLYLAEGKRIHACIMEGGLKEDTRLGNALVNMYGNCGKPDVARTVFDNISKKNVVTWTAMISAYATHGNIEEAMHLFEHMELEGVRPNKVTFVSILSACSTYEALNAGRQVHAHILETGSDCDVIVRNALITMYGKCGNIDAARAVFEKLPERNAVTWNTMIAAYAQHGKGKDAVNLFCQMQQQGLLPDRITVVSILSTCGSQAALAEGKEVHDLIKETGLDTDVVIGTAVVNMYGKCGKLEDAQALFDRLIVKNVVSWNTIISMYVSHGNHSMALDLFHRMQQENGIPDKATFMSILSACAGHAALAEGRQLHAQINERGLHLDASIGTALVNMYANCGSLEDAQTVFSRMAVRNVVSWNATIAAYAQHGHVADAFRLLEEMLAKGTMPTDVTFVSILSACGHAGFVNEGMHSFVSVSDHCITLTVEHNNCTMDLLGRAGWLDEVKQFMANMPFEPTVMSWRVLLGGCRMFADIGLGKMVAKEMFDLDPENAIPYILLSNIYASDARWIGATNYRILIGGNLSEVGSA